MSIKPLRFTKNIVRTGHRMRAIHHRGKKPPPPRRINPNVVRSLSYVRAAMENAEPGLEPNGEIRRAADADRRLKAAIILPCQRRAPPVPVVAITGRMNVHEGPGGQPGTRWESKLREHTHGR